MPPKEQKNKKKKDKKKKKLLIDDVDVSQMSHEELVEFALGFKEKLEMARKDRNSQQLQRDKLRNLWETTRTELQEVEFELEELEKTREMNDGLAGTENEHMTQTIKHVEYVAMVEISKIKAAAAAKIVEAEEAFQRISAQILLDISQLRLQLREQEQVNAAEFEEFCAKHRQEITELRSKHQKELNDAKLKHLEQVSHIKADMRLICRMEMFEVEERKNTHIENLIQSHADQYGEMKEYYNDITSNNLALIFAIKAKIENLKKNVAKNKQLSEVLVNDNIQLKGPAEDMLNQLRKLTLKKGHSDRDSAKLLSYKQRNKQLELDIRTLGWEARTLEKRNEAIAADRKMTGKLLDDLIRELEQGLHNVALDERIKELQYDKRIREVWLTKQNEETTKGCRQECEKLRLELNAMLDAKNKQIEQTRYKAKRYVKAHDDLLETFKDAFKRLGVPPEQLDRVPLSVSENIQVMRGPIGPLKSVIGE